MSQGGITRGITDAFVQRPDLVDAHKKKSGHTIHFDVCERILEIGEQTEDHAEGPRAFAEKRPPRWKAR